ncbi:MAG: hypothetical protein OCD01_10150 [Fibrobacterales bacterium]
MKKILKKIIAVTLLSLTFTFAGGWDTQKGLNEITLKGELVCTGCSLKKLDGANAQCNLFAHHALGFRSADGTIWNIVDNAKGHDVIRAHTLLEHKEATITGYIYPIAHNLELTTIKVDGVSASNIAKAGWEEDQLIAKRLLQRKIGEAPTGGKAAHKH